ncbi:uncharacterized protein LOC111711310 [Eurytemora carolleeae]|uniref:uncharacterized protein LOC111711310 n=1 Tax=Eurytemora carolleeae TaxID=1294199 RepID=UPI000C75D19E|nr:uncharacterized protein LOC111711310 [Eurytemora carolleeae]|eukprot:XP_023341411.1 uncharacterized protein LOC111711310 [Eurytemora affinis]
MGSSQIVSQSTAVIISKGLLIFFIGGVTLWYLATPYLVQPHKQFKIDFEKYVSARSSENDGKNKIENWTKWRLFVEDAVSNYTVYPFDHRAVALKDEKLMLNLEWRQHYKSFISKVESSLHVESALPWYSRFGLYNHFYTESIPGGGIRFMPRFMFGVPHPVLEDMYGGADNIPITGMLTESAGADRLVIQCFMNIVTLAVVFLLYINNPPKDSKDSAKID